MAIQAGFVRTIPGVLKIAQMIFSFIGLILALIGGRSSFIAYNAYFIGTLVALVVALVLIVFYITGVSEALGPIMNLQTYFHLIWMFYIFYYSSVLFYYSSEFEVVSAAIFGALLSITYLVDAIHGFRTYPPMPFAV